MIHQDLCALPIAVSDAKLWKGYMLSYTQSRQLGVNEFVK
jgi:hypothetical protein